VLEQGGGCNWQIGMVGSVKKVVWEEEVGRQSAKLTMVHWEPDTIQVWLPELLHDCLVSRVLMAAEDTRAFPARMMKRGMTDTAKPILLELIVLVSFEE
jgi:hypothetical protein